MMSRYLLAADLHQAGPHHPHLSQLQRLPGGGRGALPAGYWGTHQRYHLLQENNIVLTVY